MKTLLIAQNSSYTHTNLALRIFKCELKKHNFDVDLLEVTINDKGRTLTLLEKCLKKDYDIFCFSTYIWNRAEQLLCAESLKSLKPNAYIIMGGPEFSSEDESFFEKYNFCDFLIKNEGEQAILDLIFSISNNDIERKQVINGKSFAGFEESDEPYIANKFADKSDDLSGKLVYYESSRGCPFSCSYCLSSNHADKKRVRAKSAQKALLELIALSETGAKVIKLVDRTFNFDKNRAKEIFKGLIEKTEQKCTYHFEICADLIDDETIKILKSAPSGLFQFEIGVQSTNTLVLKNINRNFDPKETLKKVKLIKNNTDIHIHLDLICGLPDETIETLRLAFDQVYPLSDKLQIGFLKMLHGTEMRKNAEKYGILYLSSPPYTVLQTKTMSFSDLRTLQKIENAMDIFESDSFSFSRIYIMSKVSSPYEFYLAISKENDFFTLSRKRIYAFVLNFCNNYSECFSTKILKSYLLFDFLLTNQGTPPSDLFLISQEDYKDNKENLLKRIKNSQMENLNFPSCELYNFDFDVENTYILDRKQRIYLKFPKNS